MLALSYRGPNRVIVEEKPDPRIQHPNDVVVRVTRAAICGSDLHLYHGFVPDTRVGSTFGHEFTGVVEELGSSVQTLKLGDRIAVPFNIACGTCFYCQRQRTSICENTNPKSSLVGGVYGYSHTTGGYVGHLKKLTCGRGPDVVIDAVGLEACGSIFHDVLGKTLKLEAGAPTALNWSIDAVRPGGRVSIIGVYGPPWNVIPIGSAMNKGLTIKSGQCDVKRYLPHLLEHIRKGRIDPTKIITHRFTLAEAPEAYRLFASRKMGVIKCVLIPPGASSTPQTKKEGRRQ